MDFTGILHIILYLDVSSTFSGANGLFQSLIHLFRQSFVTTLLVMAQFKCIMDVQD